MLVAIREKEWNARRNVTIESQDLMSDNISQTISVLFHSIAQQP